MFARRGFLNCVGASFLATFEFSGLHAEEKYDAEKERVVGAIESIRDYLSKWRGQKSVAGEVTFFLFCFHVLTVDE